MPAGKTARRRRAKQLSDLLREFLNQEEYDIRRDTRLIENLYRLATSAESENVQLSATSIILERIDGKVAERKEVRSMKIAGIVHIPRLEDNPLIPSIPAPDPQTLSAVPNDEQIAIPRPVIFTK
jgi:hypothetical protein